MGAVVTLNRWLVTRYAMKRVLLGCMMLAAWQPLQAAWVDGVDVAVAGGFQGQDIYRVALRKEWSLDWYQDEIGRFSAYADASWNLWRDAGEDLQALALSPVLRFDFANGPGGLIPYLEVGIGAAYLTQSHLDEQRLGTRFQFEDRAGLGMRSQQWDLALRVMHYSNGGIKKPNDGFSMVMVNLGYRF